MSRRATWWWPPGFQRRKTWETSGNSLSSYLIGAWDWGLEAQACCCQKWGFSYGPSYQWWILTVVGIDLVILSISLYMILFSCPPLLGAFLGSSSLFPSRKWMIPEGINFRALPTWSGGELEKVNLDPGSQVSTHHGIRNRYHNLL